MTTVDGNRSSRRSCEPTGARAQMFRRALGGMNSHISKLPLSALAGGDRAVGSRRGARPGQADLREVQRNGIADMAGLPHPPTEAPMTPGIRLRHSEITW